MGLSGISSAVRYLGRIALLAACALACGCAGRQVAGPQPPQEHTLHILATGNTLGVLDPEGCGCRNLGGLARRARYVLDRRLRNPSVLVLDSGGLLAYEEGAPAAPGRRSAYLLGALAVMLPDAVHLDAHDQAALGGALPRAGALAGALLRSANTAAPPQGAVVTSGRPVSAGIFGLSAPGRGAAGEPAEAARAAVEHLRDRNCSLIIVLSRLTAEQNRALAREVPGLHLIIGSSDAPEPRPPETVGDTVLFSPGSRGTHVVEIELIVRHGGAFRCDMAVRESIEQRLEELERMERSPPPGQALEEIVLRRVVLEEKLRSYAGQNAYRFRAIALDKTIGDEPSVALLGEQRRLELLQAELARARRAFVEQVPGVALDGLSALQRLQALRLMNGLDCRRGASIAQGAGDDPACRELGRLIAEGAMRGDAEDKIRFTVLQAIDRRAAAPAHILLDNPRSLQ